MATSKFTGEINTTSGLLTLKSADGKHSIHCLPYSTYHRDNETHLSHGLALIVKGGKLTGFDAQRLADPADSTEAAPTEPQNRTLAKAAIASQKAPKPVPAAMLAALKNLARQPQGVRALDVKNQIDVPNDKRERIAIYDGLPEDLRQVFVDACEAADKRRGRK
ncbi:MAG: hypothetical protein WBK26_12105 [Burkholderiaceae bacterium]